jgi:hypothetical protein
VKSISIASVIISTIYFVVLFLIENITPSNSIGWLAFSVATGAMFFFGVFSPFGVTNQGKLFGRDIRYKQPVAIIPTGIVIRILGCVILLCILSFLLYIYGAQYS